MLDLIGVLGLGCYVGLHRILCWTSLGAMLDFIGCYVGLYWVLCWTSLGVMLDFIGDKCLFVELHW